MRNPERWRNVSLGFFLVGPLAVLAAFQLPAEWAGDNLRGVLFTLGLMGLLFGGMFAWHAQRDLRSQRNLARGEGVLARWHFSAAEWREFIALERGLGKDSADWRPNELSLRDDVAAAGVDVVVGEDAMEIDGGIHALPRRGTPQITRAEFNEGRVRPSYIELDLYYPGAATGSSGVPQSATRTRLRFPVPAGAQVEANKLLAHFRGETPRKPDFFHGPGDGSDPEDLTKCWSCGFETYHLVPECPRCGASMQSRRWSRRFGAVLVLLGGALTAGMVILIRVLLPTLLHAGEQIGPTRFNGSQGTAYVVLATLGGVLVFGLTTLTYGLFQLTTGGRAKWPVKILLAIFAGFWMLGLVISWGWL